VLLAVVVAAGVWGLGLVAAQRGRALARPVPLLDWGDVKLSIQVGLAAVYSVWAAASERRRQREEVAGWVASGLEPLQRNPSLAWSYTGSLFVVLLGFTTTMCFVARAVFDLAGG
jgi:hypothetical protein